MDLASVLLILSLLGFALGGTPTAPAPASQGGQTSQSLTTSSSGTIKVNG